MAEINNIIEALIDRGPKEWESEGDNPQAIMDSWRAYHEKTGPQITQGQEIMPIDQDMILGLVMGSVGGASKKGHDVINKIIKKNKESISNLKNLERIGKKVEVKNILDKKFVDDLLERNPNMIYNRATNTYKDIIKKFPEMKAFKGEIKENLKKGYEFVGPKFTSKSDFGAHFAREYKKIEVKDKLYKKLLPLLLGTTLIDSDTTGTE